MRLRTILETTEEDRAIISLSAIIYKKLAPYINSGSDDLVHLGKVGDLSVSAPQTLAHISIDIQGGEAYLERSRDTNAGEIGEVRDSLAFWDEPTSTIVFNAKHLGNERIPTTITHELRHALDEIKSGSFPPSPQNKTPDEFSKYFTPKKKEHRTSSPYLAQPAEINARFAEVLDKLSQLVPKRYRTVEPHLLRRQLMHDFKNLLVKYEIAQLFPERTASPDFKRLVKRAYDFIQKEMDAYEAQPGNEKRATGNW